MWSEFPTAARRRRHLLRRYVSMKKPKCGVSSLARGHGRLRRDGGGGLPESAPTDFRARRASCHLSAVDEHTALFLAARCVTWESTASSEYTDGEPTTLMIMTRRRCAFKSRTAKCSPVSYHAPEEAKQLPLIRDVHNQCVGAMPTSPSGKRRIPHWISVKSACNLPGRCGHTPPRV